MKEKEKEEIMKRTIKSLEDSLVRRLKSEKRLIKIPKRKRVFEGKIEEQAVLMLSDIHCGKINYFLNDKTGKSQQTYNFNIMKREAGRLISSINRINQLLSPTYNIRKLNIFALGDLLDNDRIIQGQKFYIEEGVGWQLQIGAKLLSEILTELLKTFEKIEITVIGGNHGRTNKRREKEPYYNNYDHLMGKILQILLENEPRVTVDCPPSWFSYKKIYKWKYFLHHGNDYWCVLGMPNYSIVRKGTQGIAENAVDMECIGHLHQSYEIPLTQRAVTLINGGWVPKDDYSWERYRKITKPEQWYFGVSEKRAKSWTFKLDLTPKR